MFRMITTAALAAALVACASQPAPAGQRPENGAVVTLTIDDLSGDASADARSAHADGRHHLYGVMGYALMFPNAERADADRLGYHVIGGTSDAILGEEEMRFNRAAQGYAAAWNAEMLRLNPAP